MSSYELVRRTSSGTRTSVASLSISSSVLVVVNARSTLSNRPVNASTFFITFFIADVCAANPSRAIDSSARTRAINSSMCADDVTSLVCVVSSRSVVSLTVLVCPVAGDVNAAGWLGFVRLIGAKSSNGSRCCCCASSPSSLSFVMAMPRAWV
jgi:hypothetical protein